MPKYYIENGIIFPSNMHLYLEIDGGIQTDTYPGPYTESLIGLEYRLGESWHELYELWSSEFRL